MTTYSDQFINSSPLTEAETRVEISFKSHRDAKSTIVKLEWEGLDGIRKSVWKAFDTVGIPVIVITLGELWLGEEIPINTEIVAYLQSVNGVNRSAWSSPQRIKFSSGVEVPVPSMVVGYLDLGSYQFAEFPDVD